MKGIVKKATAVVLAVTVMCGAVMGISVSASAASLSAGALQYGADFSFLEGLFMSAGAGALGLDMLLKTENDINNWDWGEVLDDPATQGQIDNAESKINEWYDNAIKDWYKNHGGSSEPTPTPGTSPPVTVAPINPDDLDIPEDWATLKKNATDKGLLAMGAATAYCVKEAVKGWWDDIVQPVDIKDGVPEDVVNTIVGSGCPYYYYVEYTDGEVDLYLGGIGSYRLSNRASFCAPYYWYKNGVLNSSGEIGGLEVPAPDIRRTNVPKFATKEEGEAWSEQQRKNASSKLPKTSLWPSVDTKDDYDNNRTLPSPSYPNLAVPSIKLPTLDELKDLWKQGSDDEENRPTYVTNFITNHTVQPTPEPEPTKKPEVNPNPGGGTDPDPDPEPTPSTTPAVVPDPGGGTDPQPSGSPDPNPDPGGGGDTDPDNPETPTPEEEASPYKADLREIFPFCIPFDLIHLLKVFDAEAEAPVFEFPLDIEMDNPWTGEKVVDYHHTFELDMADYEPVIKILRIFQVIFFIIALMLITRQQMIKG
ncbi:MAG: procyclic acidic repetitive family protein [Ruminococcus sp.]|nr:procyclic acidic repetitive family protein [Ruminococcus sp.]